MPDRHAKARVPVVPAESESESREPGAGSREPAGEAATGTGLRAGHEWPITGPPCGSSRAMAAAARLDPAGRSRYRSQGGAATAWRVSTMYKTIVLAYDGSEAGQRALLECQEIGQWSRAQLHLVAVMPPPVAMISGEAWVYGPDRDNDEKARYQAVLDQGVSRLRAAGLDARGEVVTGISVDEIVRVAQRVRAELIVVGHKHLESWAARWWRGSVSKSLIEFAPCSVLVVITP